MESSSSVDQQSETFLGFSSNTLSLQHRGRATQAQPDTHHVAEIQCLQALYEYSYIYKHILCMLSYNVALPENIVVSLRTVCSPMIASLFLCFFAWGIFGLPAGASPWRLLSIILKRDLSASVFLFAVQYNQMCNSKSEW